ncbi:hypothetical protein F5Y04DRAFT_250077 [Hypomontagnella monticulosa]|nr:hypothetical protein F5Y04DRAFT_250077 [Hypomontagnella monticulosa]
MCLFPYPAPKPRKSAKAKKSSKKSASDEDIRDISRYYYMSDGMAPPYDYYIHHLEEDGPAYITKGQWATHSQAAQGTLSTARENGKRLDDLNAFVSGGLTEARDLAKGTQDAIGGAHTAVKDIHGTLKEAYDTIKKNHGEYIGKQDKCAADISKVRSLLEEEVKRREEAQREQRTWEEAWKSFQQAEPRSSGSSTRTQPSSGSKRRNSNGNPGRRWRSSFEELYEIEKQQRHEQDVERTVLRCLSRVFDKARPPAEHLEGNRERFSHNHYRTHAPASAWWAGRRYTDYCGGWQHPHPPAPGWDQDDYERYARRMNR